MEGPLVTVICLCHNHVRFVEEAVHSVLEQDYPLVELILVDDGSSDGSKDLIKKIADQYDLPYVDIIEPIGNCAAFNQGWRLSSGEYLIDLAADDVLLPTRISEGVRELKRTGAGVHFSDAELISEEGEFQSLHNDRFDFEIPTGNIYSTLVAKYMICPPTMMFSRSVIDELGGYDESLAFEDFDFWVRSSRKFQYCFTDMPLVKKRMVRKSLSTKQDDFWNRHQYSILRVCEKILALNETEEENKALKKRCWHEISQCIKKGNLGLIPRYLSLVKQC